MGLYANKFYYLLLTRDETYQKVIKKIIAYQNCSKTLKNLNFTKMDRTCCFLNFYDMYFESL